MSGGRAIVWCEGAFQTTYGKTAHGLVRRAGRYETLSVVDSTCAGRDAGELLDGRTNGIPIHASVPAAVDHARSAGRPATHYIIGLAPDGGRLPERARADVRRALEAGLHVVSGLHDYLGDDLELQALARERSLEIVDVRKPPHISKLHAFTGIIEDVTSLKVAVLGTDSAVGKRTTAWKIVEALRSAGRTAELIGTGQTAWLQGATYSLILDSLVNDFVAGEIEHTVWRAWHETHADVLVIEGQGSLMNPAYPGGYEILAAGRPEVVVLQHAPARKEYDGFPGYPLHPLEKQIRAIELVSGRPVVAIALNHEDIPRDRIEETCRRLERETGLPVVDPLVGSLKPITDLLVARIAASTLEPARG